MGSSPGHIGGSRRLRKPTEIKRTFCMPVRGGCCVLAHIHHRGQLSSGHPIRAVVEQQAGQIDIASAGVDEMIAPDGRTVPVTGQTTTVNSGWAIFIPVANARARPWMACTVLKSRYPAPRLENPMPVTTTVLSFCRSKASAALRKAPSTVPIPHPGHQMRGRRSVLSLIHI